MVGVIISDKLKRVNLTDFAILHETSTETIPQLPVQRISLCSIRYHFSSDSEFFRSLYIIVKLTKNNHRSPFDKNWYRH